MKQFAPPPQPAQTPEWQKGAFFGMLEQVAVCRLSRRARRPAGAAHALRRGRRTGAAAAGYV
jgi:hypothetical protein